jgi:hypothetical protein
MRCPNQIKLGVIAMMEPHEIIVVETVMKG